MKEDDASSHTTHCFAQRAVNRSFNQHVFWLSLYRHPSRSYEEQWTHCRWHNVPGITAARPRPFLRNFRLLIDLMMVVRNADRAVK